MSNKKRIRILIRKKYSYTPERQYPKIPRHFSDTKAVSILNFGINAEKLGIAAEKASKSFLNFYSLISKALLNDVK